MANKKDTGRSMKPGQPDDPRVPAHKRKDTYGNSLIGGAYSDFTLKVNADRKAQQDFRDSVDAGKPYLDAGYRDAAQMHIDSLNGHAAATKRTMDEIARRLYKRGQQK